MWSRALMVLLLGATLVALAVPARGASSSVTVTMSVQSSTSLDTSGCAAGTASTEFGTVLPGQGTVSAAACTVQFGSTNDTARLMAVQGDSHGSALWRAAQGPADTTFDTDGAVTSAVGAGEDYAWSAVHAAEGKLVLAGESHNGTNYDFAAVRYLPSGGLDSGFGASGVARTDIASTHDTGRAAVLQEDGKLVVAGYARIGAADDVALVRYDAAGVLDPSFGTGGIVTTSISAGDDRAYAVALQADGRIVVAGHAHNGTDNDFAVARYDIDGSLDTTFDGDGIRTIGIGAAADVAHAVTIGPSGAIIVAGDSFNGANDDVGVVRLTGTGSLDTSFSADGTHVQPVGAGDDFGRAVAVQDDGSLVVAGFFWGALDFDMLALRFTSGGSLDGGFDGDGVAIADFGSGHDYGRAVLVQPDGAVVVAGDASNGTNLDMAAVRLQSNGQADPTFDGDGRRIAALGGGDDSARSVALASDGNLVLGGFTWTTTNDFAALRLGGTSISDFVPGVTDWSAGSSAFGGCLAGVGGGAGAGWTLDGNGACTTTNSDPWNAITASGTTVATTSVAGTSAATVSLYFGVRPAASQPRGRYVAPVSFQVVAPAA